jgi:peptidyl-prolyl cis-trans isomerase B (cyclophilin B)
MPKVAITPRISSPSILNHLEMDSDHDVSAYEISLILLNAGMDDGIPTTIFIF